jgi:hypothetical protein
MPIHVYYSVRNMAVPTPRGVAKTMDKSASWIVPTIEGKNPSVTPHIFRKGENEFRTYISDALEEDNSNNNNQYPNCKISCMFRPAATVLLIKRGFTLI